MLRKGPVKACGAMALAVLASIWAPGCASRNQSVTPAGAHGSAADAATSPRAASGPVVVTGASLMTEGDSPRLLLTAEGSLAPTLFSRDDGRRIVVDIPNAVASPGMEPPRADGRLLSQLGMKAFVELGVPHVQFELEAREPLESRVGSEPGASSVSVAFTRTKPAMSEAAAVAVAAQAPATEPAPVESVESVKSAKASEPVEIASAAAAPEPVAFVRHAASGRAATQLASVGTRRTAAGVVVQLAGNGEFAYEAFRLADPPRYVIDLLGVKNASKKRQHDIHSEDVSRVRISQFKTDPEPVTRVVLDLGGDTVPEISVSSAGASIAFDRRPSEQPAVATAELAAPAVPAAGSYEKHETEDAERVVAEPVVTRSTPPAPVPAVRGAEPQAVHVETAAADFSPAPEPAAVSAARKTAPTSEEAEPVASKVEPVEAKASKVKLAEVAPIAAAPAPPAVAPAPVTPPAAEPARTVVNVTKTEKAPAPAPMSHVAAPEIVAPSHEVKVASIPAKDPAPVRPASRRKPTAEDRALIEAAETLLEQQQEGAGKQREQPYESRTMGAGEKVYTGEPITLNLKDADIKDTLQKFSELTGLNIVLDPGVGGTVTVSLTDIPWDQALELILKINGLGYVLEGNIMRIAAVSKLTAEEQNRQLLLQTQEKNRPVRTVIQKLSYASAGETAGLVRNLMSARGDVFVDPRSNMLIIKELPEYLPTVLDLIKNIDTPNPQVMIEARIVEATRSFLRNLGISWGFRGTADQAHGNTTNLIFPNNVDLTGQVALPNGNQLLRLSLGNVLDTFRLDAALSAAENRGLVKVISSPKVQTQTNQAASIQSGFQIPVQTTVNNTTSVVYVDATLRLEVIPQITAEGTIIMSINVQKREPALGLGIAGGQNTPLLTRDAHTRLMVRDGGTAVIGGIFKLTANDQQNMIPGLWKIPLLGNLFRNKSVSENTDELMIFITPRIMK